MKLALKVFKEKQVHRVFRVQLVLRVKPELKVCKDHKVRLGPRA